MSPEILAMGKEALYMFAYLGIELTALFLIISFLVGVLQEFIPAERIQKILSSKNGRGYFSAAVLGSITPFCSCSTIPMLTGLLKAKAGFGPTLTFLFTSPLLNPIIIALFFSLFGMEITLAYASIALVVAIASSYLLEKLNFERFVRPEIFTGKSSGGCSAKSSCGTPTPAPATVSSCACSVPEQAPEISSACCDGTATLSAEAIEDKRWARICKETWSQFTKVLPYLLLGISIGSLTYGFMPADFVAQYAGQENWLSIPVAAIIGIPLYIRAEAVIPLSAALSAKGMGLGAVMALIIGSAGASLTEVILLKSMFKKQMIAAFLTVILSMAILAGFLFNALF